MKKLYLIGNAHLDPVWMWRWQEGFAEIKATFKSALDRMNEFEDFKFTSACACYYQWVEKNAPDMFDEICKRVKEGRWEIAGGWYIQPDCNIPSGESFARQGLYSQRYFREKFGKIAKTGYNVDSFGHNGNLPQILKKAEWTIMFFQDRVRTKRICRRMYFGGKARMAAVFLHHVFRMHIALAEMTQNI